MSICPDPELYSAYVDGELSEFLQKELEIHLSNCKDCTVLVNKYKQIKNLLIHYDAPELDLNMSFTRLIIKRSKRKLTIPVILLCFLKSKMKLFIPLALFVFIFTLFFFIPQSEVTNRSYFYKTNVQSTDFLPILPISYRRRRRELNLKEIDLHNIDMYITSNKKQDLKVCRNFINTFNNFSCLYSKLNEENSSVIDIKIPAMDSSQYMRISNMQFYINLNQNAK